MKKFTKLLGIVLIMALVMSMGITAAFATSITIKSTADPNETATDTTEYNWYQIFEASSEDASLITVDPATGASTAATSGDNVPKVSYFVSAANKAAEIQETGLFTVTKDATQDKWYVALVDKSTDADAIVAAFSADTFDLSLFPTGTFAQTTAGGSATANNLQPGYYYITSTLGDKIAVQTLADITINTKNQYPPVEKKFDDVATGDTADASAQIGDEIEYVLTVSVPATANDSIVLTDTMTTGLTFKEITSVTGNGTELTAGTAVVPATTTTKTQITGGDYFASSVTTTADGSSFTITFGEAVVTANKGKDIVVKYTAILNEDAVVSTSADGNGNINTVVLDYGNNYTSVPKKVETDTQKFTFDKVDGSSSGTKLPGAVFELRRDGTALSLIEVAAGETYRIATAEEIADDSVTKVTSMTTTGKVITVNGVDADVTYQLVETQAPTGYNLPANPSTDVKANTDNTLEITIENNKGSVLPSTGGIGTTIFYVVGSILVVAAGVLLITKKRMSREG